MTWHNQWILLLPGPEIFGGDTYPYVTSLASDTKAGLTWTPSEHRGYLYDL